MAILAASGEAILAKIFPGMDESNFDELKGMNLDVDSMCVDSAQTLKAKFCLFQLSAVCQSALSVSQLSEWLKLLVINI